MHALSWIGRLGGLAAGVMLGCGGGSSTPAPRDGQSAAKAAASVQADGAGGRAPDPAALPGALYFSSERDGNLEAYRWTHAEGVVRLTNDPRSDFVADVDPAGTGWTRVVTEPNDDPQAHRERLLWVPGSGAAMEIGDEQRRARAPSWSPDRSFVVYESSADGAFSDLWRWDRGGAHVRLTTTEHGAFEPAVSPDGTSVAFVSSQDGNAEVYRIKADGTEPTRLTNWRREDMMPRWSPDGSTLAFVRVEQGGQRLFLVDADATAPGAERRLVPLVEGERVRHRDHAWSPDGVRIAYTVDRPNVGPRVAITTVADGSTRWVTPDGLRATMPQWSPDGQYLVVAATTKDPEALDLYVVAQDSACDDGPPMTQMLAITEHPAPDWLPRWGPATG